MASGVCSGCGKYYKTGEFEGHPCVTKDEPREELLKRLVESGGCSREYYDEQIKKLKEKA